MAGPAGVRRDPKSSALQVDAKTALRAICSAVAITCFAVADHLVTPHQTGKREIVTYGASQRYLSTTESLKYLRSLNGITVDTQGGDVESDFMEGGGSRRAPVRKTIARIFPCSLIGAAIRSYQSTWNNLKIKHFIQVFATKRICVTVTFCHKLQRSYLDVQLWEWGTPRASKCSSGGNILLCSFRRLPKCRVHPLVCRAPFRSAFGYPCTTCTHLIRKTTIKRNGSIILIGNSTTSWRKK